MMSIESGNHWKKVKGDYLSYSDAKKVIKELNFQKVKEFQLYSKSDKRPSNIPSNPYDTYRASDEWKGWPDFLGKE